VSPGTFAGLAVILASVALVNEIRFGKRKGRA